MRKICTNILRDLFHTHLIRTRDALAITQEEMADRLMMADRTYADLDHGKSGCSALTFALYLIYICPDRGAFLEELRRALEEGQERV